MKSGRSMNEGLILLGFWVRSFMYIMGWEWQHGAQGHVDFIPYFMTTLVNGIEILP